MNVASVGLSGKQSCHYIPHGKQRDCRANDNQWSWSLVVPEITVPHIAMASISKMQSFTMMVNTLSECALLIKKKEANVSTFKREINDIFNNERDL